MSRPSRARGPLSALALTALLAAAAPADAARPERFAAGIPEPANLAFDARGRLWVASGGHLPRASNGVWLVRRGDRRPLHVTRGLFSALGLAWHRGELYVAHVVRTASGGEVGRVTALRGFTGRAFARSRVVVDGLPVGLHRLGSIVAGPDGRLYLGVGSRYDHQAARERLSGTVMSFRPSGRGLRIEATGVRNPYGLAFLPGSARLLISDHGRDDLGPRHPAEELNLVDVRGPAPDLGFPGCFGQGGAACRGTRPALARLAPHAAPGAVAVVARSQAEATAFVPLFGSSFDANPTGGNVVAVRLTRRAGRWRARPTRFARDLGRQNPLGAAIGPDGRLYVSLWTRGAVVRFDVPRGMRPAPAPPPPAVPPAAPPAAAARHAASAGPFAALVRWLAGLLAAWR